MEVPAAPWKSGVINLQLSDLPTAKPVYDREYTSEKGYPTMRTEADARLRRDQARRQCSIPGCQRERRMPQGDKAA